MGIANPRVISNCAVGLSWQASEGDAIPSPFTPDQFLFARRAVPSEEDNLLDPQGTHGSQFLHMGGRRINSRSPMCDLDFYGTKQNIIPLLESATGGEPVSTLANADLTEAGDAGAQLSLWALAGVRPRHNLEFTAPGTYKLYWELTEPVVGDRRVSLFKDAAKTLKVAEGTRTGDGVITLVAQNSSGLSGTVTFTSPFVADTDAANILEITRVRFVFATQISRFFRMAVRDGGRNLIFSDCSVQQIDFKSSENSELMVTVKVLARRFDIQDPGATYVVSGLDLETYSMSELTFTDDVDGVPIAPAIDDFSLSIINNVEAYVANSDLPQKLIKRGWQRVEGTIRGEFGDEMQGILDEARALITTAGVPASVKLRADYDFNGVFRLEMPVGHFRIKHPEVNGELVERLELAFNGLTDGTVDSATLYVEI